MKYGFNREKLKIEYELKFKQLEIKEVEFQEKSVERRNKLALEMKRILSKKNRREWIKELNADLELSRPHNSKRSPGLLDLLLHL